MKKNKFIKTACKGNFWKKCVPAFEKLVKDHNLINR